MTNSQEKYQYAATVAAGDYTGSADFRDPCKDCPEKTWCGGFVCKEAREYLDSRFTS